MAKAKKKFYVVWEGRETGIFEDWATCQEQIKGYDGARFKSFKTKAMATEAYFGDSRDYIGKDKKHDTGLTLEQLKIIGKPNYNSIAVDAACSGNPGILEYQGVDSATGRRLFHVGPFPKGTVNLGEFLALVHGLAYLKKRNSNRMIYSDSRTAMAWVRNKKIKTTMQRNKSNAYLFSLVDRGVKWLQMNTYENKIVKWETKAWGEIPADFGRK
ncbi:MAG: viroplasmin family protein [Chitinophagales bacterium]